MSEASIKFSDGEPSDEASHALEVLNSPKAAELKESGDDNGLRPIPTTFTGLRATGEKFTVNATTDGFLRMAAALEALEPDQCSGHIYRTRYHLAEQLRKAQAKPEHPHNVRLLRAALWLLRPSQDILK